MIPSFFSWKKFSPLGQKPKFPKIRIKKVKSVFLTTVSKRKLEKIGKFTKTKIIKKKKKKKKTRL
jgi:hypothetical protein